MFINITLIAFLFIIFICWGSFLNSFAYRLINQKSLFTKRSYCPSCNENIKFYDLIPIISWIILRAKCRNCKAKISVLYPLIEILTGFVFIYVFLYIDIIYWPLYFIFFSSLIVTIRTDFQNMLISRYVTTFLVPIIFLLSYFSLSEISFLDSIISTFASYFLLFFLSKLFYLLRNKQGLGEGDIELLAFIGSVLSFNGALFSLFLGSLIGTIIAIFLTLKNLLLNYNNFKLDFILNYKIPFGPFLAFGAIVYSILNHLQLSLFHYFDL